MNAREGYLMYDFIEDLLEDLYDDYTNNYSDLDDDVSEVVEVVGEKRYLQLVNTELDNGFTLDVIVKNLYDVYIYDVVRRLKD